MYFGVVNLHLIAGISWVFFLLEFIKERKFIFNLLSLLFMLMVLSLGIKIILLNPEIIKSGGWLHTKLSLVAILIFENLYLSFSFFKKKEVSFSNLMYWMTYFILLSILGLSLFRPF